MYMRYIIVLVLLGLASCITRKQTVLFQDKGEQAVKVDSSGSSFSALKYEYLLRPGDILNIRIGSLTEPNFDFISQYEMQMGEYLTLSAKTQKNGSKTKAESGEIGTSTTRYMSSNANSMFAQPPQPNIYVDQQSHGYKIGLDGKIQLPVVGEVLAAGLTLSVLDSVLQNKFVAYFEKVQVRSQLINFHFTVMGEVKEQGRYTNFNPEATVLEAINMANNFTEFADRTRVKIIRTQNGKKQVLYCNFLAEDVLVSPSFQLFPDDIIVVPELKAKAIRSYVMKDVQFGLGITSGLLSIVALYIALKK